MSLPQFNIIQFNIKLIIMSTSTFKNRIPKRKYRERAQLGSRQHLGLLEKKSDYKLRAKHYHQQEDQLNLLKTKAELRNQEEFYFKMGKGKRNEEGKFIEDQSDDEFDQKQYRQCLKKENYGIVKHQRSMILNKIERLKADLHLLSTQISPNTHKIFISPQQSISSFSAASHFATSPQLLNRSTLDVSPSSLANLPAEMPSADTLKHKYNRLAELIQKQKRLTSLLLRIGYEKNVLGKERSQIKKLKGKKIHKFFIERKK